jgi:hypothetical protein
MCNDHELVIGYVYGELPEAERRSFEAHLAACPSCRQEANELRATRVHLASWAPPEPDLGFRIVRNTAPVANAARRTWFAPAWGLAAAAVLLLAAAAAIANVEVRYDSTGLTVRTGWAGDDGPAADVPQAGDMQVATASASEVSVEKVAALDARVRELEAVLAQQPAGRLPAAAGPRLSDAEMLRRVREIVSESEGRQQRDVALQLAQALTNVDRALQMNFVRMNQGLGQHRAQTQAEIAAQVNYYLTRVSNQK